MDCSREITTNTKIHTPHFTYICDISSNYYRRRLFDKYGNFNLSIRNISSNNYLVCGKDKPLQLHNMLTIKNGDKLRILVSTEKNNSQKLLEWILDNIEEKFTEE